MDGSEKLKEVLNNVEILRGKYEEMAKRSMPKTLKQALADGWEMEIGGLEVNIPDWIYYGTGERERDSHRVLPLKTAIQALGDLEEELIESLIRSRASLFLRKIRRYRQIIEFVWKNAGTVWDAVKLAAEGLYDALQNVNWGRDWVDLLQTVGAAFAVAFAAVTAAMVAGIISIFVTVTATAYEAAGPAVWLIMVEIVHHKKAVTQKTMQKKAFPQSKAPRFKRRKEARL